MRSALVLLAWACMAAAALSAEGDEPERLHGEPEPEPPGPEPEPEPAKPKATCHKNIAPLCACDSYTDFCILSGVCSARNCPDCPERCVWDNDGKKCDKNKPKPPPGEVDDSNSAARAPAVAGQVFVSATVLTSLCVSLSLSLVPQLVSLS